MASPSIKLLHLLYWIILHVLIASGAVYALWDNRPWLLLVEVGIALSLGIAIYLARELQKPVSIMKEGLNLIKDKDLATHFIPNEQEELKQLINVYNTMIDNLRKERQSLKEKQFFLEKLIDASQTGVVLLDYNGNIEMVNPRAAAFFGGARESWEGLSLESLPYPFGHYLPTIEVGETDLLTLASRKRMKCSKSEFFDQGFPRKFIMIDELTEELRLSEKAAYEKLIRVISHEINNSLGAVSSLLHTCLHYGSQLDEEDQEDYNMALKVMISRSDHLGAFMRSYADVIRLEKPKKRLHDIEDLIKTAAHLFKAELAQRNIRLEWSVSEKAEKMIGLDAPQIEQVLVNIVKNAMEAVEQHGYLRICIEPYGNKQTLLYVEDSGPGIREEVQSQLFTPFFSTKPNGQGIGLTMIQEILVQHNFEFALESASSTPTRFKIWMS